MVKLESTNGGRVVDITLFKNKKMFICVCEYLLRIVNKICAVINKKNKHINFILV